MNEHIENGEIHLVDGKSQLVNILFAGDFYAGKMLKDLCRDKDYGKIYNNSLPILRGNDISVVNLESPLSLNVNPIVKDGPHLSADPSCVEGLKYAGFKIATLANNHILDQGSAGVAETIKRCNEAGIKTVGAGKNRSEAEKPLIIELNSIKVGFLNITENEFSIAKGNKAGACGLDLVSNYSQIMKLKNEVDSIILIIHGGNELFPLPNPQMVKTYRFFADLGVTAIIGHHSHCASGFEIHNGVPIFYSLGNFIFESESGQNDMWYHGYLVKLVLSGRSVSSISLYPYEQFKSGLGVRLLDGEAKSKFLSKIKEYSDIIQNPAQLDESWSRFCSSAEGLYLPGLLGLNRIERALVRRGICKKFFIRKKTLVRLINLIRCEAHREASLEILESNINHWK